MHRLEAALKRGVLLDVLAVLVKRGGTHGTQLTAGQHGLQQVGGVNRTLALARTHDGVQLVDEQDDLALGIRDLLEHGLQAVLELAAVLRAGDERAHVKREHALAEEPLGHVAIDDSLCEPLDDGGLAHAGFTDEHGVVLGAARQHLDDTAYLLIPADDRVELARGRGHGEVAPVLLKRLVLLLGVRVGHTGRATHLLEGVHERLARDAAVEQQLTRANAIVHQRQQQVLGADVFVLQVLGFLTGLPHHGAESGAELDGDVGAAHRRACLHRCLGSRPQRPRVSTRTLHDGLHHAFGLVEQCEQQVLGLHQLVALALRQGLCARECLACAHCGLVNGH